jgi:hypothetical protein
MSGDDRPAFYALRPGGWRDYVTLLHPPYTLWHLSYVAIGAAAAPQVDGGRLVATIMAFFLAVGLAAHALDELGGRPLGTKISDRALQAIAGVGLIGAVLLGLFGTVLVSPWLLPFVAFGAFIVLAYNLELFDGWFHTDAWFAVAWGAFPALTGYFAQAEMLRWQALLIALACLLLSAVQRRLSTPVRNLRRRVIALEGRMRLADGREVAVDESLLREAPEAALRAMAVAMVLLATGLVAAKLA